MDHDGKKTTDALADQAPGKQTNTSVAPSGQHTKPAAGAPTKQLDLEVASQPTGVADVQDSAVVVATTRPLDSLIHTGLDSVEKKKCFQTCGAADSDMDDSRQFCSLES
jgi:hypothetical protein